jgi:excisionase family DNA binding protein
MFKEVTMTPALLTVDEAAAVARVSRQTIVRAAARGEFRTVRVGTRARRVVRDDFMAWMWGPDWRTVVGPVARDIGCHVSMARGTKYRGGTHRRGVDLIPRQ